MLSISNNRKFIINLFDGNRIISVVRLFGLSRKIMDGKRLAQGIVDCLTRVASFGMWLDVCPMFLGPEVVNWISRRGMYQRLMNPLISRA